MEERLGKAEEEKNSSEGAQSEADVELKETESAPAQELSLEDRLAQEKAAAQAAQDRYLRALADFENFKKRAKKEQSDLVKFGNEGVMKEILPVIDNLERAISHSKESRDFEKMLEGICLIQKQFVSVLEKFGVRPIESLNKPFDPFQHQSVGQIEVEAQAKIAENEVVRETQKGYLINERVLRPSLVMLAKRKPFPSSGEGESGKGQHISTHQ